jgi:uncharacterized protein YqgC (DUF456 family)
VTFAWPAGAEEARPDESSDAPTVSLLTMGPGDHPFSKFGHVAIVVRDPITGREDVFNYGTFSFNSPWLIVDFLKGKFLYWLSVDSLAHTVAVYRRERRSVLLQELVLPPESRRELAAFLRENARPENKYYRYDYYLDNCATRVRDVLDRAALGRFRAAALGPGRLTFRGHTMRLVAGDFPLLAALDIVMGPFIDEPITEWDEMFLPDQLVRVARRIKMPSPGGETPLVSREIVLATTDRPPQRDVPPSFIVAFAAVGTAAGGTAFWLVNHRRRAARVLSAVMLASLGLVSGLLGMVFALLWALTDHRVAYRNENLLLCNPLALALCAVAFGFARGREGASKWAHWISLALAILATADLLVKAVLHGGQHNGHWIAFFAPLWWALAVGTRGAWKDLRTGRAGVTETPDMAQAVPTRSSESPSQDRHPRK